MSTIDELVKISQGAIKDYASKDAIYEGKRLTNSVLKNIVLKLKRQGLSDEGILNLLLKLDELVEKGEFNMDIVNLEE